MIGTWLVEARAKSDLSLMQVSHVVLGQNDTTLLIGYEEGRATVPERTLRELVNHYGVPWSDLTMFLDTTKGED